MHNRLNIGWFINSKPRASWKMHLCLDSSEMGTPLSGEGGDLYKNKPQAWRLLSSALRNM